MHLSTRNARDAGMGGPCGDGNTPAVAADHFALVAVLDGLLGDVTKASRTLISILIDMKVQ